MIICQNCGYEGDHVYCSNCGQPLHAKRISLSHLWHEVTHTFWHLEKGLLFTLKQLATKPGTMQRKYLSGLRLHYQKPFPLFAITGTFGALSIYFIYHNIGGKVEEFWGHYYFIVQTVLLPFYALITYLLFKNRDLYYAEALVMTVYMLGFMSILIIPLNILSFFLPNLVISILEIIFLVSYNIWTNLNFFKGKPVWWIIVKSIASIIISYLLSQYVSNLVVEWLI